MRRPIESLEPAEARAIGAESARQSRANVGSYPTVPATTLSGSDLGGADRSPDRALNKLAAGKSQAVWAVSRPDLTEPGPGKKEGTERHPAARCSPEGKEATL